MPPGCSSASSTNFVVFMQTMMIIAATSTLLISCLRRQKHPQTPQSSGVNTALENTATERSEESFAGLRRVRERGVEKYAKKWPRSREEKKLPRTEITQQSTAAPSDLQTCPSRELTRTKTISTEMTTEGTCNVRSAVTCSTYQPPPAPPRDVAKDRARAKNALQLLCQREKNKESETSESQPISNFFGVASAGRRHSSEHREAEEIPRISQVAGVPRRPEVA
ncbi:hypothetical protein L596_013319 [Steinernema carpocapsae]|uniref:Uncharacterized protein n=1 Tax=Steinernema carpocapsae TaxID=34508 RepID=A0A4U5NZT1_STECR|nr:hypothetical protein L596_013319 [Steinernema carpocapsae]